jgi:hypothetical protein
VQVKPLSSELSSEGSGKIKAIFPMGSFKPSGLSKTLQVMKLSPNHVRSATALRSTAVHSCPHSV